MARITIEDCLKNVDNMYELVHVSALRARQLFKGANPLIRSKNRNAVIALREIAQGLVLPKYRSADMDDEDFPQ